MAKAQKIEGDLRKGLKRVMSSPYGMIDLEYNGKTYMVLQFHVSAPLNEQTYDVHTADGSETRGLDFDGLVNCIESDTT